MLQIVLIVVILVLCGDDILSRPPSEIRVVGIELAQGVDGKTKMPTGLFNPVECSKNRPSQVLTIDSSRVASVWVWTRISSDAREDIRHKYYVNGDEASIQRAQQHVNWQQSSSYGASAPGGVISYEHTLSVGVSEGWRTWSNKKLDSFFGRGDWRVEIRTIHAEEDPLCTVHFKVR